MLSLHLKTRLDSKTMYIVIVAWYQVNDKKLLSRLEF